MQKEFAIVTAERSFLYAKPWPQASSHDPKPTQAPELTDEMLSGWAVEILEETGFGWYKVRTFYGYEGWIFEKTVRRITDAELRLRQEKSIFLRIGARMVDVLDEPRVQGTIRETLQQDSIVELLEIRPDISRTRIRTASGAEGWVFASVLKERQDDDRYLLSGDPASFLKMADERRQSIDEQTLRQAVIQSAYSYLGTQYRWGGKSSCGIDCSGLVFMSYLEQGILLYRDACILENYPVREIPVEQLREGDLIFFPGHVALSLGGMRFLHATGFVGTPRVIENSFSPKDPDFRQDLADKITKCGSVF